MQYDIFNEIVPENQLKGIRICLNGTFAMPSNVMTQKLKAAGVVQIDRVSSNREYKEGENLPPVKEGTCLYVVGSNPNEESIKRYELNKHDGYEAMQINEQQLIDLLTQRSTLQVPNKIEKKLNLTFDYYNWTAPTINDKVFVSRVASPVKYDLSGNRNPLSLKEIYVPDYERINMNAFRQLIGNVGGYANKEYYDDTNIIMLSDETINQWRKGIKDKVIIEIETRYNQSDSKIFNVQFTSESEFIEWIKARLEKYPDASTQKLYDSL